MFTIALLTWWIFRPPDWLWQMGVSESGPKNPQVDHPNFPSHFIGIPKKWWCIPLHPTNNPYNIGDRCSRASRLLPRSEKLDCHPSICPGETCAETSETRPENEDKAPGAVLGDATQLQQLCGSPPAKMGFARNHRAYGTCEMWNSKTTKTSIYSLLVILVI